jgi:putative transposase
MGISRSPSGGVAYTVYSLDGRLLKQGRITERAESCQILYVLSKQIVEIAKTSCSQVILESNGGKNDRMPVQSASKDCLISNQQYAALAKILRYKLPEQKLPQPIEVSANGLFFTCPRCANRTAKNRISDELFACIECGYASETEWIGSENLANRLVKYQRDKVPLTVSKKGDSLVFYNKDLGFQCVLPQNVTDYRPMYDELNQYLQSLDGTFQNDTRRYAIWKKLRQACNIHDAVRLVSK